MNLNFSKSSVLVTGDVMLDRYWFGDTTRISPEAPVPVVHVSRARATAGGAANVAVNISNLGSKSGLISVVGADEAGRELAAILDSARVNCHFLEADDFPTVVKLRLLARGQQVVRADFEERPERELLLPLIDIFSKQVIDHSVVVFSDYGKGGLCHLQSMMEMALAKRKIVLVDPKGSDYSAYRGATLLTPNRDEFALVAGRWISNSEFFNSDIN